MKKILLYFLILIGPINSFADEVNEAIAVLCDHQSQEMKVKSLFVNRAHMEMTEVPKGYALEITSCEFSDGKKLSVKLLEGNVSANGRCGANPPIQIKLTKSDNIVSEFLFSPRCGGLLVKSVTISKESVEICEYVRVNYRAPWVTEQFASEPEFTCRAL